MKRITIEKANELVNKLKQEQLKSTAIQYALGHAENSLRNFFIGNDDLILKKICFSNSDILKDVLISANIKSDFTTKIENKKSLIISFQSQLFQEQHEERNFYNGIAYLLIQFSFAFSFALWADL